MSKSKNIVNKYNNNETNIIQYSINEFKKNVLNKNLFKLDDETLSIIKSISDQVGDPEYIKTPQFYNNESLNKKNTKTNIDDNWDKIRNFKATINNNKKGIDMSIDIIRKNLNKMTEKSYENIKSIIINELKNNVNNINDEEWNKLGVALFSIASTNIFYSEIYAKLYKFLISEFPNLSIIFKNNFNEFNYVFKTIEYVDPEVDYDKFCDINKTNEKRRALSLFYVNLMKYDMIDIESVLNIILELNDYVLNLINEENNKNVVEELSEVIFIMIKNGNKKFTLSSKWKNVIKQIESISILKRNEKPSISNKTIFKYMDMLTLV